MDHLQAMRVFAKVVEQGSFVRAAEKLEISTAATTRQIGDLEARLGTRLLNRTTRTQSLTEAGRNYLERVQQILQDVADADAIVASDSKKPTGTMHIYSQLSFGQAQLAHLLHPYAQSYPDIGLNVTLTDRTVDLVEEGFDVGFFLSLQKFDASMIARQLAVSNVVLCASRDYVKRHGAPTRPEDLAGHACLNFAYEQFRHRWEVEGPEGKIEVPIRSAMMSNNAELLRQSAAAGMGVVMRPSFSLCDDLTSGRLVRLLPGYRMGQVAVNMIYPSRRFLSGKVRSFVDFINARFPHPESDPWLSRLLVDAGSSAVKSESAHMACG